jgi:hypothetical protein
MLTINDKFRMLITRNEIGDDNPLEFSDPDGVRSGKSGWSFGGVQWDTKNNHTAIELLIKCGFTPDEIKGIVNQTIDVNPLNGKLKSNAELIEEYDEKQLQYCLNGAGQFAEKYGIAILDQGCLLALADTINQYGSLGSVSAGYLKRLDRPVTAKDVLAMKLTWKYSATEHGKADTERRYHNLEKVLSEVA